MPPKARVEAISETIFFVFEEHEVLFLKPKAEGLGVRFEPSHNPQSKNEIRGGGGGGSCAPQCRKSRSFIK